MLAALSTKQVFRLENKTGTISGGGSARLRWRFLPLEAKQYVLRVTVRTVEKYDERLGEQPDEKSVNITLRAVGYDPRERDPHRLEIVFRFSLEDWRLP